MVLSRERICPSFRYGIICFNVDSTNERSGSKWLSSGVGTQSMMPSTLLICSKHEVGSKWPDLIHSSISSEAMCSR